MVVPASDWISMPTTARSYSSSTGNGEASPSPGRTPFAQPLTRGDDFGVLMYINSPDFPNFVGADAGTLTVSSSSAGEMQGTVELEASSGEADPVTVQVEFAAVRR